MRSLKLGAAALLLAGGVAFAQSKIVYTLELGGDNKAELYEQGQEPTFVSGASSGVYVMGEGELDLTWAVRVSVGGTHQGDPGDGLNVHGAANLVFDLHLLDDQGNLVADFGAAEMSCVPAGAFTSCTPTGKGFWSSINDGDDAGGFGQDLEANAAFTISIHNQGDGYPSSSQHSRLIDPVTMSPSGPNFDYGWYPTANSRGGIDIGGTKTINRDVSTVGGKLVGFGAGYKSYEYQNYRPGVGKLVVDFWTGEYGFGAFVDDDTAGSEDPLNPPAGVVEKPLFEGQISVRGMAQGTYTLKIVPSVDGNNVLHGGVVWDSTTPDYSGAGSFAAKANEVHVLNDAGLQFVVTTPPPPDDAQILARNIFYNNSYYDGNKVAIDAAPIAGANNDDADAIDPSKSPLMVGQGAATFANWTGYNKGINGLIYDIKDAQRDPVVADFIFTNKGKAGTTSAAVVPTGFLVQATGDPTVKRVILTFENVIDCWLEVTIGTGFGLPAAETHWWGNAMMDSGTFQTVNILVDANDEIGARNNPRSAFNRAPVTWAWDYDKNSICDSTDQILARNNPKSAFTCVKVISR